MKPILPPAPEFPPCPADKGGAPGFGANAVLLACGNPLRQDDGVGLRIAEAVERAFLQPEEQVFPASGLRIVAAQQWTPELASELAEAEMAIFVDACVDDEPGAIRVRALKPGVGKQRRGAAMPETHGLDPEALLALTKRLYGHAPARAFVLTVGTGSLGYGEGMTGPLRQAVPRAVRLLGNLLAAFAA